MTGSKILCYLSFIKTSFFYIFTGHTSVKMCERLMANIQMVETVRKAFMSREAFNVHPTTKHKEQDPFPDHLKGMWFLLKEDVVSCIEGREVVKMFPVDGSKPTEVPVPKKCCDIYGKGCKKVEGEFVRKLHECFPSVRNVIPS